MIYLRVKKWRDHQHYAKRRPPWIKLYNDLIDDDVFEALGELEQWQLVRIWLLASRSTKFAPDDEGIPVPVVPRDEPTLRRAVKSLKRIPIGSFEQAGFLIAVNQTDVVVASKTSEISDLIASALASTALAPLLTRAGATENQREPREAEEPKSTPSLQIVPFPEGPDSSNLGKLCRACRITDMNSEDARKLGRAMRGLPEADIADIAFSAPKDVRDRLAWTLSELKKRRQVA